jgi:hypothetical protein
MAESKHGDVVAYLKDAKARKLRLEQAAKEVWANPELRKAFCEMMDALCLEVAKRGVHHTPLEQGVEEIKQLVHSGHLVVDVHPDGKRVRLIPAPSCAEH